MDDSKVIDLRKAWRIQWSIAALLAYSTLISIAAALILRGDWQPNEQFLLAVWFGGWVFGLAIARGRCRSGVFSAAICSSLAVSFYSLVLYKWAPDYLWGDLTDDPFALPNTNPISPPLQHLLGALALTSWLCGAACAAAYHVIIVIGCRTWHALLRTKQGNWPTRMLVLLGMACGASFVTINFHSANSTPWRPRVTIDIRDPSEPFAGWHAIELSPAGDLVALSSSWRLKLWDTHNGEVVVDRPIDDRFGIPIEWIRFSRDGKCIAYGDKMEWAVIRDVQSWTELDVPHFPEPRADQFRFLPDGVSTLSIANYFKRGRVVYWSPGQRTQRLHLRPMSLVLGISPNCGLAVVERGSDDGVGARTLEIHNLRTQETISKGPSLGVQDPGAYAPFFSTDGNMVAIGSILWDVVTGSKRILPGRARGWANGNRQVILDGYREVRPIGDVLPIGWVPEWLDRVPVLARATKERTLRRMLIYDVRSSQIVHAVDAVYNIVSTDAAGSVVLTMDIDGKQVCIWDVPPVDR